MGKQVWDSFIGTWNDQIQIEKKGQVVGTFMIERSISTSGEFKGYYVKYYGIYPKHFPEYIKKRVNKFCDSHSLKNWYF